MRTRELQSKKRVDWECRLNSARIRALGLSEQQYRAQLVGAAQVWCWRFPWRFLPQWLALRAFEYFGRRFAARWIAALREGA